MKTKSSAKSSPKKPSKPAPKATAATSRLASIKGAVKTALFGSTKPTKAAAASKPGKASAAAKPAKAQAPVKTAESVKAAPAKAAKGKGTPAPVLNSAKAASAAKQASAKLDPGAAKLAKTPRASSRASVDAEAVCREVACEGLSTTGGYCRLHYVKNWKKIKRKELILKEGKLNQYIEELVAKYPDKYIEAIRQDLADDKAFAKVIYDLDLDESVDEFDVDGENVDSLIDTIKRDFDDEGETF